MPSSAKAGWAPKKGMVAATPTPTPRLSAVRRVVTYSSGDGTPNLAKSSCSPVSDIIGMDAREARAEGST